LVLQRSDQVILTTAANFHGEFIHRFRQELTEFQLMLNGITLRNQYVE
jgi:hypothetical protein